MAKKPSKSQPGRRGNLVSLATRALDRTVDAIYRIKPADRKRTPAKRTGKGKRK